MARRGFLVLIPAGLLLLPGVTGLAGAQGVDAVRRIGWLSAAGPFEAASQRERRTVRPAVRASIERQ
jgi:hypothetical protein